MITVLDKGYVRLVDRMGTDLSVVNAARVSFAKESDWAAVEVPVIGTDKLQRIIDHASKQLEARDAKLLKYLAEHGHMSPFRHAMVTLEIKAPLFVARQWWKYVVGSDHTMDGWNEVSRRYVEDEPEFYLPDTWRSAPENKKQGSGEDLSPEQSHRLDHLLRLHVAESVDSYEAALKAGVCAEQARLFLPAYAMYTSWRWTASLESVIHFIRQRTHMGAQKEIFFYAEAVETMVAPLFPKSFEALLP